MWLAANSPNWMEVYSWGNHRTKWWIFQQAMFDKERVYIPFYSRSYPLNHHIQCRNHYCSWLIHHFFMVKELIIYICIHIYIWLPAGLTTTWLTGIARTPQASPKRPSKKNICGYMGMIMLYVYLHVLWLRLYQPSPFSITGDSASLCSSISGGGCCQ